MTTSRISRITKFAPLLGVAALLCGGPSASAQGPVVGEGGGAVAPVAPVEVPLMGAATQTLCGSCGGGGCASCGSAGCGEGGCYPGRECCTTCEGNTRLGRLFCAFHNALCCPDPCYQPRWNDAANAAFFTDYARTTTLTRFRWDHGTRLTDPDRADFFMNRQGATRNGVPVRRFDYDDLSLYQEFGGDKFSAFIDLPFRNLEAFEANGARSRSGGFGDLAFGTKTMFLDSELLQMTFQFKTKVPTGNATSGIGTGSVSLEPSLLTTVKLYNETYWQSQLSYWFAVGNGNGSVVHYHNSLNRVLFRPLADTAVIGTFETVGWTFTSGQVTNAAGVRVNASGTTYFTLGPGVRLAICDKLDLGFGMQFAVTDRHFAEQLYRTELRWRY